MAENHWLTCAGCGWSRPCLSEEAVARLRAAGMLRRNVDPAEEEIAELIAAFAGKLTCPECGSGLEVEADAEDWPEAPVCASCGAPIDPERLEVFPDTRLCVACQGAEDRGEPSGPVEYCSRCGSPMTERPTQGAGLTRWQLVCTQPGCRGRGS